MNPAKLASAFQQAFSPKRTKRSLEKMERRASMLGAFIDGFLAFFRPFVWARKTGLFGEVPKSSKDKELEDLFQLGVQQASVGLSFAPPEGDLLSKIDKANLEEVEPKVLKKKGGKNVCTGIVHVLATFNNTIVSISDLSGTVIAWSSAGKMGFRGSRKATAYAAQLVAEDACRQAMEHGLKEAEVRVKGPGAGRESAVRAVQKMDIEVTAIRDVTPTEGDGCAPKGLKRRKKV